MILDDATLSKISCFANGALYIFEKDFYSCTDLSQFVDKSTAEYPYLSGFKDYFRSFIQFPSTAEINESDILASCVI